MFSSTSRLRVDGRRRQRTACRRSGHPNSLPQTVRRQQRVTVVPRGDEPGVFEPDPQQARAPAGGRRRALDRAMLAGRAPGAQVPEEEGSMAIATVSGSASGIGAAVRSKLESEGFEVIGIDLRDAEVEADLSTPEGRRAAVDAVIERCAGKLDRAGPVRGARRPPRRLRVDRLGQLLRRGRATRRGCCRRSSAAMTRRRRNLLELGAVRTLREAPLRRGAACG